MVCVHPQTAPDKLAAIDGDTTTVLVTERAINSAKRIALTFSIPNLRPSVDEGAVEGYGSLAMELAQAVREHQIEVVVLFATSGASAVAVAQQLPDGVQLHVVQGEGNAGIVGDAATDSGLGAAAGGLGVRRSRRAQHVRAQIERSGGRGWVVTAEQVAQGREWLMDAGIVAGDESAANYWVSRQLAGQGHRVVCVLSGAPPVPRPGHRAQVQTVADEWEAVEYLRHQLQAVRT